MKWMTDIQSDWTNANEAMKSLSTPVHIPDGVHRAALVSVEPDEERPMIRLKLRFLDFNNVERTKVMFFGSHPEYARNELAKVGLDGSNPMEVLANLEARLGHVFDIYVRSKKDSKYSDMYFNANRGETVDMGADMFSDDDPTAW